MRNGIWQQLGTGSRKSGLKLAAKRAVDSTLGGSRLGIVRGILGDLPRSKQRVKTHGFNAAVISKQGALHKLVYIYNYLWLDRK